MAAQADTAADLLATFSPRRTSSSPRYEKRTWNDGELTAPSTGEPKRLRSSRTEDDESANTPSPTIAKAYAEQTPSTLTTLSAYQSISEQANLKEEAVPDETLPEQKTPSNSTRTLRPRPWPKTDLFKTSKRSTARRANTSTRTPIARKSLQQTLLHPIGDCTNQESKIRQENFLLHHKALFTPLLPQQNHITKLEQTSTSEYKMGHEIPFRLLKSQPSRVQAELKEHQMAGLSFLVWLQKNGASGILGDEMGLGKTLQTLSLFQYLEEENGLKTHNEVQPHLVICPLSVIDSWVNEARKWTPDLRVLRFHGSPTERTQLKKIAVSGEDHSSNRRTSSKASKRARRIAKSTNSLLPNADPYRLIVTSYEVFASEKSWFKRAISWNYVVLDERHKIKNESTQVSQALFSLRAKHRLILTGTPLQNNMLEMWALLHWLYPDTFTENTSDLFRKSFDLSRGVVNTGVLEDTKRLLELICLRRLKDSVTVHLDLPPKNEILLYAPLTALQRSWYTRILTKSSNDMLRDESHGLAGPKTSLPATASLSDGACDRQAAPLQHYDTDNAEYAVGAVLHESFVDEGDHDAAKSLWQRLMNTILQLRKICSHPYLISNAVPEPYTPDMRVILASGKYIMLQKLIQELVVQQQKKVLIFSGFTGNLNFIEDMLQLLGDGSLFKYARLDGGTPRARRNLAIRLFNTLPEYKVMLISTRAGGLGITLTAATEVVFMDEDWNPQITLQAEARAHRIGQTKPVTVYKLCTQGTVEEQMLSRIRKKLYLSIKVTADMHNIHERGNTERWGNQSAPVDDMPQLDNSTLKSLIRHGSRALTHPSIDAEEMMTWDFQTMIAKCRDVALDETSGCSEDEAVSEEQWLSIMERVDCTSFDGKKHERQSASSIEPLPDTLTRADRRVDKNTTVIVNGFAVSKESLRCAKWEAVPTLAGKDPCLSEPRRAKKEAIEHQEHCQVCFDTGKLICCSMCPRSYHEPCMKDISKAAPSRNCTNFICTQHRCATCQKTTSEAGGMLYRCRWCPCAWCEDCLVSDERLELINDTLPEYEALSYSPRLNAFYIRCSTCAIWQQCDEEASANMRKIAAKFEVGQEDMETDPPELDSATDAMDTTD